MCSFHHSLSAHCPRRSPLAYIQVTCDPVPIQALTLDVDLSHSSKSLLRLSPHPHKEQILLYTRDTLCVTAVALTPSAKTELLPGHHGLSDQTALCGGPCPVSPALVMWPFLSVLVGVVVVCHRILTASGAATTKC